MNEKLKPCPFCGSDNLSRGHVGKLMFYVSCLDCRTAGPDTDDYDNATNRWNRRAEEQEND